jgi:26S proteasome regulatory subunit N1
MMSVLGMTYSDEERLDCLKYRLEAPSTDLGSWGHEYMRHLALEIGREFQNRLNEDKSTDDVTDLASNLVPFFLKHNAEADAVDILSELEMIDQIEQYIDENTYARVALYMIRYALVPLLQRSILTLPATSRSSHTPTTTSSSAQPTASTAHTSNTHKQ